MSAYSAPTRRHIWGVLAPGGRISRNNNGYLPEELARANGKTVNFFFDHEDFELGPDGKATGRILNVPNRGQVRLMWNEDMQRLEYDGYVVGDLEDRNFVSLAAEPQAFEPFHGHNYALGLNFFSVSAVRNPGIPETTLNIERVIESMRQNDNFHTYECVVGMKRWLMFESQILNNVQVAEEVYNNDRSNGMPPKSVNELPAQQVQVHPDFQKLRASMGSNYQGWLQRYGFDESQPYPSADYSCPHGQKFEECQACGGGSQEFLGYPGGPGQPAQGQIPQQKVSQPPPQQDVTVSNPTGSPSGNVNAPPGSPIPGLAKQNPQLRRTGFGNPPQPMKTGVGSFPGTDKDPHLGGTGNTGVTGTGNITPMAGVRPASGTGITGREESSDVKESKTGNASPTMATVAEEAPMGDVSSAQDKTMKWPKDTAPKSIGIAQTPYEMAVLAKVSKGESLTAEENRAFEALSLREKKVENSKVGSVLSNPNRVSTIPTKEEEEEEIATKLDGKGISAGTGTSNKPGDQFAHDADSVEEEEEEEETKEAMNYGYSKEALERLKPIAWSSMTTRERRSWLGAVAKTREMLRAERLQSVKRGDLSTATSRMRSLGESGVDVMVNGVNVGFPDLERHLENIEMTERTGEIKHLYSRVPFLMPPRIERGPEAEVKRYRWANAIESYTENKKIAMEAAISEAVATTTTGAAMAIQANAPALIVPQNLAAILRDTVYFQQVEQGYNTARFQTVTVPSDQAATENVEPSQASQTFATVDIKPSPRAIEQQISFEAQRKVMGPILEAVILSFRVAELYAEDYLLVGGPNTPNITNAANQAFEAAAIPTTGGVYTTGNQLFGTARANEAAIVAGDTMTVAFLDDGVTQLQNQGYASDNVIWVGSPNQYRKLLIDANAIRMVSFGPGMDNSRSMLAQGVIPELIGAELRKSTLVNTGTGSGAITTYHSWIYKKGLTAAMAASRDVMIETFRDIRTNSTWVKAHYDLKCNVLQVNSLVEVLTA